MRTKACQAFGALLVLSTPGVVAHAQDTQPPGIVASFDVTQRLEYSDNPDLDVDGDGDGDFFGRTLLGFNLASVTTLDSFSLSLGTQIEEGQRNQSSINFTNTDLGVEYERATRSANISGNFRYREADVSDGNFEEIIDQDGNAINQNSGTRQVLNAGLSGAVGQDAPIGATYGFTYSEITYNDTNDLDLTDSKSLGFNGSVDFRITPRITTQLVGRYSEFDALGNGVNRETTGFGIGAQLQINPVLNASGQLRYDRIERSGDEIGTDEGLSFDGSLSKALKNGSIGLTLNTDITSNDDGRRTFIGLDRDMDLPRGQALSYSLGLTRSDGTGVDPLVAVDYSYPLQTAALSFSLSQSVVTDSDNEERINTSLRAGYDKQINNLSSIAASLSFFNRNELGDSQNDGQRIDISLSYNYALTRDWGLVSGYSHIISTQDDEGDRSSNTIFVGLQRNFNWRP